MKAFLLFLLKLCLTATFLWWAVMRANLADSVFTRQGGVDYRWIAAAVGFGGLSICLHALRWWFFLRGQSIPVSYPRALELMMIDGLFNLVSVSGLGGDAARIILLVRDKVAGKLACAMAVMMDHLAGCVSIALWFLIYSAARFAHLTTPSVLGKTVIHFAWFYLGGGLLMVVLMFVCASPPVHRRIHANNRFARWPILIRMPEICNTYRRRWKDPLAGLLCSFPMLAAYSLSFYCALRSVGGNAAVSQVLTAMPVIDAISGLPVSVAGMGVRETLFQTLMGDLAGISAGMAVTASLAGFACNALWALAGALFFLRKRDRVSRREIEESDKEITL